MATIKETSVELEKLVSFLFSLTPHSYDVLSNQFLGTWSIQDIISHIMGWDKDFLKTLEQIVNNEKVILKEHPDVQSFNDASVEFGRKKKPQDLINDAIYQRKQMILKLNMVTESAFISQFNNSHYTLESFLQEMFVFHDKHHIGQIMQFLKRVG
ncbi:MAG: ClbS/DfsB family four-helix bundle protein [Bacillus sp. (in: Bacteria)]|nr:ClbS/DfsB family four-helix bundle protein [Bacillus sp. (in: firmicutes)]